MAVGHELEGVEQTLLGNAFRNYDKQGYHIRRETNPSHHAFHITAFL